MFKISYQRRTIIFLCHVLNTSLFGKTPSHLAQLYAKLLIMKKHYFGGASLCSFEGVKC